METKTAVGISYSIPSDHDAALADRAGQTLEALANRMQPVSARFGNRTVDLPTPAVWLLR